MSKEDDLKFLEEIRNRLNKGLEKKDPSQIEYAQQMINDWIDELKSNKSFNRNCSEKPLQSG